MTAYKSNEETPFTGKVEEFHEDGKKKAVGNFVDGRREGLWNEFWQNGHKRIETNYKGGVLDGIGTSWFSDGQLEEQGVLNEFGEWNGPYTAWWANGHKAQEGDYKDGLQVGRWIFYNPSGKESYRSNCSGGEKFLIHPKWLNFWV